ncbi:MAG: integrase arm-type DNA-binding domain-containing protein [Methylomonas sp.]|nr:integrase arm-type DNA-binding domain-containing protein [Methylomonas sp.]
MAKERLSDLTIRTTKPTSKDVRLFDGNGLYLLIKPNDSRWWRLDYIVHSKRKTLSLGTYPVTSLADARKKAFELKRLVASGVDPAEVRKASKEDNARLKVDEERSSKGLSPIDSFKFIADEWFNKKMQHMAEGYKTRVYSQLQRDVFPHIGNKQISEVTTQELLKIAQEIERRGAIESAHRTLRTCGQIIRYAVVTGRLSFDFSVSLKGALTPVKNGHFSAVTDIKSFKELLIAIESFTGSRVVYAALRIAPHVFVRPGELRTAKWADIDLENKEWRYLVTKTNTQHIVPLSKQVISILEELKPFTGHGYYVFPSIRTPNGSRPMSDVALLAALRRLGYEKGEVTVHGFRATARTLLDEVLKFRPDYIEHQLAHSVKDPLGRAYNRTTHLEERRNMMQEWSNYLTELKA